jgi:hypothetical protein
MPVFRIGEKLCYFAHVPKCGGSSVEAYLRQRFGPVGFCDNAFTSREKAGRWSRTSPQHIDWASFQLLIPEDMLDAVFAVVRHPVARIVSAYHFQAAVEHTIPPTTAFSDWLRQHLELRRTDKFAVDNHLRPQVDFMPENCTIFHLEHGLDAIVPYLDRLAGGPGGPRAIGHKNKRRAGSGKSREEKPVPDAADIALISEYYACDFAQFGYNPDCAKPAAPRPVLPAEYVAARNAEIVRRSGLLFRATARIWRGLARRFG